MSSNHLDGTRDSAGPGTNYFVCTLGEALAHNRPFEHVNHLLQQQAVGQKEKPAIGFYKVVRNSERESIEPVVLSFEQVYHGISETAELLSNIISTSPRSTVGLLSASSPEFLFTWLACIRFGLSVLLIAPECSAEGIVSLCSTCYVDQLLVDHKNQNLAAAASKLFEDQKGSLSCHLLPFEDQDVFDIVRKDLQNEFTTGPTEGTTIAYLHHTSGTSSGMPKSIPQSHKAAVGVLPSLEGQIKATFTTTPLYHGGPADIFRAWTSSAMIWLFPSKDLPITASNICKCLEAASGDSGVEPKYFATVPYILQSIVSDREALKWLLSMDLVSVGGAALPQEMGDTLVQRGVNLVSRFGSAECGFLLSSNRHYSRDKEWQYLRHSTSTSHISFEPREDDLCELIVHPGWPHLAKTNRPDGSYATSDLFEAHPSLDNAWRYHSRADSQLTLVTGKKFDPATMEDALVAGTDAISDAFIFGNGQPYPGVLVFRSAASRGLSDERILRAVKPVVERLGSGGNAHARIPGHMIVPIAHSEESLEKSSKGTVLRKRAEERYAAAIEKAYETQRDERPTACSDEELSGIIKRIVVQAQGTDVDFDMSTDLFSLGIDSMASIHIRNDLQRLLPPNSARLPTNIVEDCGNVKNITNFILDRKRGKITVSYPENDHELMKRLVEKYSDFPCDPGNPSIPSASSTTSTQAGRTILLTGATGSLGSHVFTTLQSDPTTTQIHCLVRGATATTARERLSQALAQRYLPPINPQKTTVHRANLSSPDLGLAPETYSALTGSVTTILHLAWSVNFRLRLRHFEKESIASVKNLLDFALQSTLPERPRFAFCSSVASVGASSERVVKEEVATGPGTATEVGYSKSKWAAEGICAEAGKRVEGLKGKVSIWRVGQLSGDRENGVWNGSEAWPLMLGSVRVTGCLPRLEGEVLDWLPVDVAARGMVEGVEGWQGEDGIGVFHVVNDCQSPRWEEMLGWLRKRVDFEVVEPLEWVKVLESAQEKGEKHAAFQLLGHWREAFSQQGETKRNSFDMTRARAVAPSLQDASQVDEAYFNKLWDWIEENVGRVSLSGAEKKNTQLY